jgi:hypothetical protein
MRRVALESNCSGFASVMKLSCKSFLQTLGQRPAYFRGISPKFSSIVGGIAGNPSHAVDIAGHKFA